MAFTFNWTGVQGVKDLTPKDRDQQIRSDAAAWGNALKGYDRYQADKEYKKLLEEYNKPDPWGEQNPNESLASLMNELQQLKARNAEIKAQLGG